MKNGWMKMGWICTGLLGLSIVGWVGGTVVNGAEDNFRTLDINGDGVLSGREAAEVRGFDRDQDGEVTRAEFDAGQQAATRRRTQRSADPQAAAARFRTLDGNQDGRLSGTEMKGLNGYDANGDQRITLEEFVAAESAPADADAAEEPEITLVVPQDETPFRVARSERVRLSGHGIAGSTIRAEVEGKAKLVRSGYLRSVVEGQPTIGGLEKEFEFQPTGPGPVTVRIIVDYPTGSPTQATVYRFTVE